MSEPKAPIRLKPLDTLNVSTGLRPTMPDIEWPKTTKDWLIRISSKASDVAAMKRPLPRHTAELANDVIHLAIVTEILMIAARERKPILADVAERVLRMHPLDAHATFQLSLFLDKIIDGHPDGERILSIIEEARRE